MSHDSGAVSAIGWSGRAALVEPLIAMLEDDARDYALRRAAALALQRVTGAIRAPLIGLGERTELASAELLASRYDAIDLDAGQWRRFWEARGVRDAGKRRFGKPYTPSASLDELAAVGVPNADRRIASLEYEIASTSPVPLPDPHDWVARQTAAITAQSLGTAGPRDGS
jgi:hypothetical protein